eukprot:GHVQ01002941.1.p1 GENE.GHVQ01002941.1~~GHVQ01002941.1.p1  ORF type:complete len:110 (+),score=19.54 GHVQ01002941.1:189-518(+)
MYKRSTSTHKISHNHTHANTLTPSVPPCPFPRLILSPLLHLTVVAHSVPPLAQPLTHKSLSDILSSWWGKTLDKEQTIMDTHTNPYTRTHTDTHTATRKLASYKNTNIY